MEQRKPWPYAYIHCVEWASISHPELNDITIDEKCDGERESG